MSWFHSEMSETRRWLVRTREMERRAKEERMGIKKIEEHYKHLVRFPTVLTNREKDPLAK